MFKPTNATSAEEYVEMLPEDRKEPFKFIDSFIKKNAPGLKPNFIYNMPGYGKFKYKNNKKQELDWPVIALASQKNYISVYVCAVQDGEYIAEKYKNELGKGLPAGRQVSVGRSCIRFKKVEDLNLETLKKIIRLAVKFPGLQV